MSKVQKQKYFIFRKKGGFWNIEESPSSKKEFQRDKEYYEEHFEEVKVVQLIVMKCQ